MMTQITKPWLEVCLRILYAGSSRERSGGRVVSMRRRMINRRMTREEEKRNRTCQSTMQATMILAAATKPQPKRNLATLINSGGLNLPIHDSVQPILFTRLIQHNKFHVDLGHCQTLDGELYKP